MIEEDLVDEDHEARDGEEDVDDAEGGGEEVSPPLVFPVDLVEMFAVKKYNWEEPEYRDLIMDYR